MNVVFLDTATPRPYDHVSNAPGGTEMTVARVAEGLARRGHRITVAQRGRKTPVTSYAEIDGPSVRYAPINADWVSDSPDLLVVLRRPEAVQHARRFCNARRTFLWCHDFNQDQIAKHIEDLRGVDLLAVSNHQGGVIRSALRAAGYLAHVLVIYPPVDDDLCPDGTQHDPHRLLFACSPHKGLDRALVAFEEIHRRDNRFQLFVTNPGYYTTVAVNQPGVTVLGTLTYREVVAQMRRALCLLHPNDVYPETFGMVHAEANAVGTPVIAVDLGATHEVLGPTGQVLPGFNANLIAAKVQTWSQSRPAVRMSDHFRLSSVLDAWEEILS